MFLADVMEDEKVNRLTPDVWNRLADMGKSAFPDFPFFNDPKFIKLDEKRQRLLLAWSLKDVVGFKISDAYLFATKRKRGDITDQSAYSSARTLIDSPRLSYFTAKLDWIRTERLGFTANRIIQAETELAYSDITAYLDEDGLFSGRIKDLPGPLRRAVKSIEVVESQDRQGNPVRKFKLQLWDKGASLQRMQKMKGMHVDVAETTNKTVSISGEMSPTDAAKAYQDMMRGEG